MSNQNDPTASVYDQAYEAIKGEDVVLQELQLIISILSAKSSKIVDIGCGTGRHLVKLHELGYDVVGIDSSAGMLQVLKQKSPGIKTFHANFLEIQLEDRFDLVMLLWNTLAEIAQDTAHLEKLFSKLSSILSPNGKILLNFDSLESFDPAKMDFTLRSEAQGTTYDVDWKVLRYDAQKHISVSHERIRVAKGKETQLYESEITQKWWARAEIENQATKLGFLTKYLQIEANNECYLLLN